MTTQQFLQAIEQTYAAAVGLVKLKNKDYATSIDPFKNFRYAEYCDVSVEKAILVRISDKFARLNNIIANGEVAVKDEQVKDTIRDMCNYLAILGVYLDEINGDMETNS